MGDRDGNDNLHQRSRNVSLLLTLGIRGGEIDRITWY